MQGKTTAILWEAVVSLGRGGGRGRCGLRRFPRNVGVADDFENRRRRACRHPFRRSGRGPDGRRGPPLPARSDPPPGNRMHHAGVVLRLGTGVCHSDHAATCLSAGLSMAFLCTVLCLWLVSRERQGSRHSSSGERGQGAGRPDRRKGQDGVSGISPRSLLPARRLESACCLAPGWATACRCCWRGPATWRFSNRR